MKRLIHWFAAAWCICLVAAVIAAVVALAVFLLYQLCKAAWPNWRDWLGVAVLIATLALGQWASGYIDKNGWPWKREAP